VGLLAILTALLILLSACAEEHLVDPESQISIPGDVLRGKNILDVQRVDTDSDGEQEWLTFYRFDQVGEGGPVAALIYDVVPDLGVQLPIVYPYKLRTPAQDYLALNVPKVLLVEIAAEAGRALRKELVLYTGTELIFFRLTRDPGPPPADNPPMYRCIGFFRSAEGVSFDQESLEVAVITRSGYERSELVTKHYYRPEGDGYFITGTETLVPPFASAVDFPAGIPEGVLDTPYPEKIVLAFYKTFREQDADAKLVQYLSPQAATEFGQGKLRYGSPFPRSEIKWATVKELSYYPTQDDSQSTVVIAKVVFTATSGQQSALTEVRWRMIRVQTRWKMDFPES
jgi:hypothetical protein